MDQIINYLKQLDLSEIEAKLYLRLLQSGPTSVRELAETTEMKRTTAYFYIEQLLQKGLMVKLVQGSKKLIAASAPESLEELVENKLAKATDIKASFPSIVKTINASLPTQIENTDADIKYYKGQQAIKTIYKEALATDELRSYVKLEETNSPFPEDLDLFKTALKENTNLIIKEIFYNSPLLIDQAPIILAKNKRYEYKLMPNNIKMSSGDTLIFKDKVAIVNYQKPFNAIVLTNRDFYNNSKELFDFIWNTLN